MSIRLTSTLVVLLVLGCQAEVDKPPVVRPVRAMKVQAASEFDVEMRDHVELIIGALGGIADDLELG